MGEWVQEGQRRSRVWVSSSPSFARWQRLDRPGWPVKLSGRLYVALSARCFASSWMRLTHLSYSAAGSCRRCSLRLRNRRIAVVSYQRGIGWIVSEGELTKHATNARVTLFLTFRLLPFLFTLSSVLGLGPVNVWERGRTISVLLWRCFGKYTCRVRSTASTDVCEGWMSSGRRRTAISSGLRPTVLRL